MKHWSVNLIDRTLNQFFEGRKTKALVNNRVARVRERSSATNKNS